MSSIACTNVVLCFVFAGFRNWDVEATGVDINDELAQIANRADLGEEGPNGKLTFISNHHIRISCRCQLGEIL